MNVVWIVWNIRWRLQQFVFRLHMQNPRWDWVEMETQSDTRHNLKTTPTPTPNRLFALREAAASLSFIYNKKKKKMSKSWYVTMCIANKLKKNNKYVFISCRPQKTSVLGHKSGLKRDDRPSNHHADARSPGQPTPPFIQRRWASVGGT